MLVRSSYAQGARFLADPDGLSSGPGSAGGRQGRASSEWRGVPAPLPAGPGPTGEQPLSPRPSPAAPGLASRSPRRQLYQTHGEALPTHARVHIFQSKAPSPEPEGSARPLCARETCSLSLPPICLVLNSVPRTKFMCDLRSQNLHRTA